MADPAAESAGRPARKHALILAGTGRFGDRRHDFMSTSRRIAEVLTDAGFHCEVSGDVDERLADLTGVDLLVLNVGRPRHPDLTLDARDHRGLLEYLERGGPLLAMHRSSGSMLSIPEWEHIVGVLWIRGTSSMTDQGLGRVLAYPERHPIVSTVTDFDVYDTRYCYLRIEPDVVPLLTHEHDGIEHALLWARTYGPARIVYDALGHAPDSFDSPEHREVLARAARWLVGDSL